MCTMQLATKLVCVLRRSLALHIINMIASPVDRFQRSQHHFKWPISPRNNQIVLWILFESNADADGRWIYSLFGRMLGRFEWSWIANGYSVQRPPNDTETYQIFCCCLYSFMATSNRLFYYYWIFYYSKLLLYKLNAKRKFFAQSPSRAFLSTNNNGQHIHNFVHRYIVHIQKKTSKQLHIITLQISLCKIYTTHQSNAEQSRQKYNKIIIKIKYTFIHFHH